MGVKELALAQSTREPVQDPVLNRNGPTTRVSGKIRTRRTLLATLSSLLPTTLSTSSSGRRPPCATMRSACVPMAERSEMCWRRMSPVESAWMSYFLTRRAVRVPWEQSQAIDRSEYYRTDLSHARFPKDEHRDGRRDRSGLEVRRVSENIGCVKL